MVRLRIRVACYLVFAGCVALAVTELARWFGLGKIDLLVGVAAFVICGLLGEKIVSPFKSQ
jgi:uncharacterized membrane protein